MEQSFKHLRFPLALLAVVVISACGKAPETAATMPAAKVSVAKVLEQPVNEWDEFTGRLEAPETVEIRPRVSGQIDEVAFTEGALVKKGDLLFQIDPRPFQAEVRRLEALVAQSRANATRSENEAQRGERLRTSNAISAELADSRTSAAQEARAAVGALQAQLDLREKRKPVYDTLDRAIEARMKGLVAVSREAAELLAQRGLMPVPGGYTWRTDNRLTLPSPLRLTTEQAMAFVQRIKCPATLVVAADGMLAKHPELLERLPFSREQLPGGHHLHLNDESGADLVADCFNRFFAIP